jgi:hypothetical protein
MEGGARPDIYAGHYPHKCVHRIPEVCEVLEDMHGISLARTGMRIGAGRVTCAGHYPHMILHRMCEVNRTLRYVYDNKCWLR